MIEPTQWVQIGLKKEKPIQKQVLGKTISKPRKPNDLVMQIFFIVKKENMKGFGYKPSSIFKTDIVHPLY